VPVLGDAELKELLGPLAP